MRRTHVVQRRRKTFLRGHRVEEWTGGERIKTRAAVARMCQGPYLEQRAEISRRQRGRRLRGERRAQRAPVPHQGQFDSNQRNHGGK